MNINKRGWVHLCLSAVLFTAAVSHSAAAADYLAMSGKELYGRFCASCHGIEAHGDGPAAASFKIEVPDLTLMASRQGRAFSPELIERIIDGRHLIGAHGTRDMPVWGEEFTRSEIGNPDAERATRTLITRIADFISAIQKPAFNAVLPIDLTKSASPSKSDPKPRNEGK